MGKGHNSEICKEKSLVLYRNEVKEFQKESVYFFMSLNIVGGVFSDVSGAENAIEDLRELGFSQEDISVFAQDESQVEALERGSASDVTTDTENRGGQAGKGLGWGALTGGILGGLAGLLAGGAAIAIPGAAPLVVAGAGSTALAGAATGAVGGGIVGVLVGAGLPEDQAQEFEEYIEDGKIVVLVKVDESQKEKVEESLNKSNSEHTSTSLYVAKEDQ